jgi:hypothetical protein
VRLFLFHCADVHRQDKDRYAAHAQCLGRTAPTTTRTLILARPFMAHTAPPTPRLRHRCGRNTALHWACTRGDLRIASMLVEFDAAVNLPERGGWYTPFHWAGPCASTGTMKTDRATRTHRRGALRA